MVFYITHLIISKIYRMCFCPHLGDNNNKVWQVQKSYANFLGIAVIESFPLKKVISKQTAYRIFHLLLCCAQTDNQVQTVLKSCLMGLQ